MNLDFDDQLRRIIAGAKAEDFGGGDITANLLPKHDELATFALVVEEPGVWAGREVVLPVLHEYDPTMAARFADGIVDGTMISSVPATVATLTGPLGTLLSAERVLLNFVQRLAGIATLTRRFVDAVAGMRAEIFDTRKTTPGWRALEKYAVRCGGGRNHRRGLFDAVLIKDNHLAGTDPARLAYTVFEMLNKLDRAACKPAFVEVEADDLAAVEQLLQVVGIDVILLDNFTPQQCRQAVELRDAQGLRDRVRLEASGGITLETARTFAETGVERISAGCLTHSARSLDMKLERLVC